MPTPHHTATQRALNTPKLIEGIFSYFSIKPVARALRVSKTWNAAILASPMLRRTLFLEAKPATEHIEAKTGVDAQWYKDDHVYKPVILSSPSAGSRVVSTPHPSLPVLEDLKTYIETSVLDCKFFTTVSAATFLFQPPAQKVILGHSCGDMHDAYHDCVTVERTGGVAFGDLVEELEKLHAGVERDVVSQFAAMETDRGYDRLADERETIQQNHAVFVKAGRAVDTASSYVRVAREAKWCEENDIPWEWSHFHYTHLAPEDSDEE